MREKLIELLNAVDGVCPKDASCYDCEYKDVTHCAIPAKADYLIANGVTIATDNNVGHKWISVKDRLPEYGQLVLVCDVREDYVGMAVLQPAKRFVVSKSKDYWDWHRMECQIDEFTHWMPLPQPPKGE